jgi:signal transduction histidine kinase
LDPDDYYDKLKKKNTDTPWDYTDRMVEPFFGIKTLHDQKKIYIFIDFEFWHQKEHELLIPTIWGYIVVMIVALIIGWYTANRVINPLKRLMKVVENSDPNNIPTGFAKIFKEDEIGALARAFEASLRRIQKFIKREYQFTRDASHELRTPVTVIKGAVELLKMSPACEDTMTDKLVRRIERSTSDMETTIESLLWLARESNTSESVINADLLPLIENAIEQNKHLTARKAVKIDLQVEATPLVKAPTGVLAIAISNLIRNACQFTTKGSIIVTLRKNRIDVEDTGIGICQEDLEHVKKPDVSGSSSDGFGFGLDIVNRLCSRFDWRLNIESIQGKGTKTSLIFH